MHRTGHNSPPSPCAHNNASFLSESIRVAWLTPLSLPRLLPRQWPVGDLSLLPAVGLHAVPVARGVAPQPAAAQQAAGAAAPVAAGAGLGLFLFDNKVACISK